MTVATVPPFSLGTFSIAGCAPFVGLVVDGSVVAVHAVNACAGALERKIYGADNMLSLLGDWSSNFELLTQAANIIRDKRIDALTAAAVPVEQLHTHAPVERPGQMLMARANYRKHIIELSLKMGRGKGDTEAERRADMERMVELKATEGDPFLWVKTQAAVSGPFDAVEIPKATQKADWEVELAVVIGKPARHISKDNALDYVAGYCIANDLSARDLLTRDEFGPAQDWLTAKCPPQFMPMGPYLVPKEFIADPNNLPLLLKHNGKVMQDDGTADMIHDVQTLIAYASSVTQLEPGDIISTGSPAGNGMEFGLYLQPGDEIEATIEGLGTQRYTFKAEA